MKVSVLLDDESAGILKIVFGQGGHEFEEVSRLRDMTTKFLFISNGKLSIFRYWFLKWSKIFYFVVRDTPSVGNGSLVKKFYMSAMGDITYPTKASEIEKCIRALVLSSHLKKQKKDARAK